MSLVVSQNGAVNLLWWMLKSDSVVVHLYQNDLDPTVSTSTTGFSECAWSAYGAHTIVPANWAMPTTVASGASILAPAQSWTIGGNAMVYGYYITTTSNTLLWSQRFSIPRAVQNGDQLVLTPQFSLTSAT